MTLDEEIAATQKKLDALLLRKKERFTPCPWHIDNFLCVYAEEKRQDGVHAIGIADVDRAANARLIREAPEMYAIVERIAATGKAAGELICEAAKIVQRVTG